MRKKMETTEKRNSFIGIKVKTETRNKLEYISEREAHPISTQIDIILKEYIEKYFQIAKIEKDYKEWLSEKN